MSPTIRKIFLTAGHRGGTSGANYNGINEAEETIWLRNKIVSILRKKEIDVSIDDDTANLSTVIETINSSCSVVDICVDLHFNAFSDNSVNGTEVLKPNNYSITISSYSIIYSITKTCVCVSYECIISFINSHMHFLIFIHLMA